MTGDDGDRRKLTRPLSSLAAWLRKRRERANAAELARRVATSTAARILAGAFVVTGSGMGLASTADVLDGKDGRPAAQEQPVPGASIEDVSALAEDAAALRGRLDALSGHLDELLDADPLDLAPVLDDLIAIDSRLLALTGRVLDVEEDLTLLPPGVDVTPLSEQLDAVVTDVLAARQQADAAALRAGEVADGLAGLGTDVGAVALEVADVADSLHLLAADLADVVDDVTALSVRVATLEADVSELDGEVAALDDRVVQTETLTTDAMYAAFVPQALAGQQRGQGPTFTTRAESLATVTVRTSQGGEQPAATIYIVRTDGAFAGTSWSESPATVGNVVHVALLPPGGWRIDIECDQPCTVGTGLVVVQPVGTFTP